MTGRRLLNVLGSTARRSVRFLVALVGSASGSPQEVADAQAGDQDTKYGTHRVEEDDPAECSLEQSVAESNMDRQPAQCSPPLAEAQAWRRSPKGISSP